MTYPALKQQLNAIRTGNQVIVAIEGFRPIMRAGDKADELFNLVQIYNQTPSQDILNEIMGVDENLRRAFADKLEINDHTGQVYLQGTSVPIPRVLNGWIGTMLDQNISPTALVNFWTFCLANPDPRARASFINYVIQSNVTLTESGFAVLYKAVYLHPKYIKEQAKGIVVNSDLAKFVVEKVPELHQKKRNPWKYHVYHTDEEVTLGSKKFTGYFASENDKIKSDKVKYIDKLEDLFAKINEGGLEVDEVYTDMYSKKMEIRIGKVIFQKRENCTLDPFVTCARGLHIGSYKYVKQYGTSSECVILTTLVNPANVLCAQEHNQGKMRVSEYYPFGILKREDGGLWHELPPGEFELKYLAYERKEMLKNQNLIPPDERKVITQFVKNLPNINSKLEAIEVNEEEKEKKTLREKVLGKKKKK